MIEDNVVRFQLNLLERWQLFCGNTEVHIASRQQRLISALALYGPRNRRYLSGLLWPDSPDARALESLRVSLHRISHQIPGLLVNGGSVLSLADHLDVDLHQCREQVRTCINPGSNSGEDPCLAHVLHSELLPGWYEDWVVLEQHRFRDFRLNTLILHAKRWLDCGEAEKAAAAARSALTLEPINETCVWLLMRAELKMGNRAGALYTFKNFRATLARELGVNPSDQLMKLAAIIRG